MSAARKNLVSSAATEAPQSPARRFPSPARRPPSIAPCVPSSSRPPSSPARRVPPPPRCDPSPAQRVPSSSTPRPLPASGVLLDIDAPEASPSTNVKGVPMSPGCAELTGLDFPRADVSPSLGANTHGQQIPMLRKLVDTTRLTQQLVDQVSDVRDSVASNIVSALDEPREQVRVPVTEHRATASSGECRVEYWLSQTPADPPMSLERTFVEARRSSFLDYRSPENTSTSSNSAPQELPTSGLLLSPRRCIASEAMIPFEELRVSESPRKPTSQTSRAANSLDRSIHAAPWPRGHRLGEATVIGVRPSMNKEQQSRLVTEFEGLGVVRGSSLDTRHIARSWSTTSLVGQPITPRPEGQKPSVSQASAPAAPPGLPPFAPSEPKPRAAITAQPLTSRGPTGVKVIGVAPFLPNYPVARDLTNADKPNENRPASSDTRVENKAPPKVRTIDSQTFVRRT